MVGKTIFLKRGKRAVIMKITSGCSSNVLSSNSYTNIEKKKYKQTDQMIVVKIN